MPRIKTWTWCVSGPAVAEMCLCNFKCCQVTACSLQCQMPEILQTLAKIWDCCTGVTMQWDTNPKRAPLPWGYLSPRESWTQTRLGQTQKRISGHLHFDVSCQNINTPHRHRSRHYWHLIWHRWSGSLWKNLDRDAHGKEWNQMPQSTSLSGGWSHCTALLHGLPGSTTSLSLLPIQNFSLLWETS